jgi:hypothetical protein
MAKEWLNVKDVPWWYNERASLSLFAGAVWGCHGWVFEEFGIWRKIASKRGVKYTSGRRDIEFEVGDELMAQYQAGSYHSVTADNRLQ